MEESLALVELESSWRLENERFRKFQRLANRDLQLAQAYMDEKQRTDFQIRRKLSQQDSKFYPKIVTLPRDLKLIPNQHFKYMKEKIKDLELRVQLLSSRKKQFHSVQLENNSLKNDNQILRHQLNNISQLSEDTNNIYLELQKQSPTIKNNSFENINQLHLLKQKHLDEELVGCHITYESMRCLAEGSLTDLDPKNGENPDDREQLRFITQENGRLRSIRQKTPKNLDSYDEHVERIIQLAFVNDLRDHDHQNAIRLLEKKYSTKLEKSFALVDKIKCEIKKCDLTLPDISELYSQYKSESELRSKREQELNMMENAFQQQESDFKKEIEKFKSTFRKK